jgi:hypothetical protein
MNLQSFSKQQLQELFIDLHSEYLEASKDHKFGHPKTLQHLEAKRKINEVIIELSNRRKKRQTIESNLI